MGGARINLKFKESKAVIDTPQPGNNHDQAEFDLEKVRANPEPTAAQRHYAQYVVRALKATGRGIVAFVNWTDKKGGFITALATVVIAILTAFYVHYSRAQWQTMRDQLSELHVAAVAAANAATTADTTLKSQQKSFEIDQRPYMVCDIPVFSGNGLVPDKPITANVTFKNIGRTPARRISAAVTLLRFDPLPRGSQNGTEKVVRFINAGFTALRARNSKSREAGEKFQTGTDIAPNATMFTTNDNLLVIPSSEFKKTESGATTLFYIGTVTYKDSFGNLYETEFCALYFGTDPRIWHVCDNHNTIK
jgi:hypothetical protein